MSLSGTALVIKASGIVAETIEEGAYVALQVKYGLIRLISTKADLCEQVKNVDKECPIEAGSLIFEKSVDLPREIPNVRTLYPLVVGKWGISTDSHRRASTRSSPMSTPRTTSPSPA